MILPVHGEVVLEVVVWIHGLFFISIALGEGENDAMPPPTYFDRQDSDSTLTIHNRVRIQQEYIEYIYDVLSPEVY